MGHIAAISRAGRALGLAASLAMSLALGGCGGIEFQGKVFDYMGLSGDHQQADVRMAERPPLLLPPNLKQLPQPGTGVAVATARPDWPTNPEVVQKQVAKDKAAQEAKQQAEAEADPTNPYAGKPTLLDKAFSKLWGKGDADASPVDDVPEPDPSDKRPEDKDKTAVASSAGPKPPQAPDAVIPTSDNDPFHPVAPDSYKAVSGGGDASHY
ncbi:MAG TPA: hypothetical protein VK451_07435 [Methyloceanibacter sp.]|nr:hypothetical protein [Methyloceanibacter sp.]